MILMSEKGANKKNYYADARMKAPINITLKIRATMIDAAQVTKDQK